MPELVVFILLWGACGVLAGGFVNAYRRKKQTPIVGDLRTAINENIMLGPVGLYIVFKTGHFVFPPSFKDGPDA